MQEHFQDLPVDDKGVQALLMTQGGLGRILSICERGEQLSSKLDEVGVLALKYQLLCYLIKNDLNLAKYLWKRLPNLLKPQAPQSATDTSSASAAGGKPQQQQNPALLAHANEFKAIWTVGQAMWREEYTQVYKLINSCKCSAQMKPFLAMLENSHRQRMIDLVNKAFTSISLKELNEVYLGIPAKQLQSALKDILRSQPNWTYDSKSKIVSIAPSKEDLTLDAQLLNELTQYVCFMEAQQNLEIDSLAKASQE